MPGARDPDACAFDWSGDAELAMNGLAVEHEDPVIPGSEDPDTGVFDWSKARDFKVREFEIWLWRQSEFHPADRTPAEIQGKMTVSAMLNLTDGMEVD